MFLIRGFKWELANPIENLNYDSKTSFPLLKN